MPYRHINNNAYAAGPGPVSYYLNTIKTKNIVDVIGYQDIVGSYYYKSLGIDEVVKILIENKCTHLLYVVCDHATDDMHNYEVLLKKNLKNVKVLTITGNGKYLNTSDNDIIYFPYYWYAFLEGPQQNYVPWVFDPTEFASTKQYPVSCLNNLCRFHRIKLLDKFFYKPYFKKMLYSFNSNKADDYLDHPEMQRLTLKWSRFLPLQLDRKSADYGEDMLSLNHPGLHDSYLNIITSNHFNVTFIDEKMLKPIAAGQIFVGLLGPGTIQLLRDLGFDTFDDIVDQSYDNEPDLDLRISKLVAAIDKWMQLDHEIVWKETYQRRLENAQHFFNLDVRINPLKDFLADI